jgi:hypothetical protein
MMEMTGIKHSIHNDASKLQLGTPVRNQAAQADLQEPCTALQGSESAPTVLQQVGRSAPGARQVLHSEVHVEAIDPIVVDGCCVL